MPNPLQESRAEQQTNRSFASSLFIGLLVALAYQEMVAPVREASRAREFFFGTFSLTVLFFTTTIRFTLGNQLHLSSKKWIGIPGWVWFLDFAVVVFQSTLMIFMGGLCSARANRQASLDFIALYLFLLLLDILWFASRWIHAHFNPELRRVILPWEWAAINSVIAIAVGVALAFTMHYDPSGKALFIAPQLYQGTDALIESKLGCIAPITLAIIGLAAFIVDIVLCDKHQLLRKMPTDEEAALLQRAMEQANLSLNEGGFPGGAVICNLHGEIVASGRNMVAQRKQKQAHAAEICLESLPPEALGPGLTMIVTSMPCGRCAGAIAERRIERLIVGDSRIDRNPLGRSILIQQGVDVHELDDEEAYTLLHTFRKNKPDLWKQVTD